MWPDFKQVLINAIKDHHRILGDAELPRLRSTSTNRLFTTADELIAAIEADDPDMINFFCVDVIGAAIRAIGLRDKKLTKLAG